MIIPYILLAQQLVHYQITENTGKFCTVAILKTESPIINGNVLCYGDEVAIFNSDGICCGAKAWNPAKSMGISVLGECTEPVFMPGMRYNEAFQFRIWSVTDQFEYTQFNVLYYSGNGLFTENSLQRASSIIGTESIPAINAPVLSSPTNCTYLDPNNAVLSWLSYNNAVSYQIQISKISDFSSYVYDVSGVTGNQFQGVFEDSTYYFWRVRAELGKSTSDWSKVFVFHTIAALVDVPEVHNSDFNFEILPNPFQEKISINMQSLTENPVRISIFDFFGNNIKEIFLENSSNIINIDLSILNSGTYYLILETNKNKFIKKLIKLN